MEDGNERIGRRMPIRRRVRWSVIITTVVAIVAAFIASMVCMVRIRNEAEGALSKQLKNNLTDIVEEKTSSIDAKLEHYEKYIEFLTDYIEAMYPNKDILIGMGSYIDAPRESTGKDVFALTGALATEDMTPEDAIDDMKLFSNLERVWEQIAYENDGLINTVYAGTVGGFLASYDKWSYISSVPEGEYLYYNYFESDWYKQGLLEDGTFYTGLYVDSQGRGLTITVASPFKDQYGNIQGVDCADFDITGLYDDMISMDFGEGSYSFAVDAEGGIISPDAEGLTAREYTGLKDDEFARITSGQSGILEKHNDIYVYAPISRLGWTLCARIPRDNAMKSVENMNSMIVNAMFAFFIGTILIALAVLVVANKLSVSITYPMELLGEDMALIAAGDLDHKAVAYRNDEVGDMTYKLNEMVEQLKATLKELDDSKHHAEAMSELANKDALTGIRNKTAYDKIVLNMESDLKENRDTEFGIAMIDLNYLKKINDTYGHDKGNIAIKKLCMMVCHIFAHSPVFRIGGDEFVVILKSEDYNNIDKLIAEFEEQLAGFEKDDSLEAWEKVSAAIGYAIYDKSVDGNVEDVFKRADNEMYECKKKMKALRE
ncbi:MAG: diguanylate cyclase [Lachnospiraceae bacterium]|nr:diguanylate cyclase [Lachnospiraceae bacterium]